MSPSTPSRDERLTSPLSQKLAELLGAEAVLPAEAYSIGGVRPEAAVRPTNRQQAAQALEWANRGQLSVAPWGGGVLSGLGNVPPRVDLALDLSRINRVLDYQPADLTATVEGGITLEELRRELARGEKVVPLEAPFPGRATVGGILAANFSGPMRYAYGLPRDWLIGVSVLGADGEETKSGGRVVKNVTGYDLNKLYTGSLGTLAVIVEATFKLTPLAEARAGLVASFPSLEGAIAAGRSLISQVYSPQGLQVANGKVAEQLSIVPSPGSDGLVMAFMEGRPRATARRVGESASLLVAAGATGVEELDAAASFALAQRLTDLGWDEGTRPSLGMRIDLSPSAVGRLLGDLPPAPGTGVIADVGFGVVQTFCWEEPSPGEEQAAGDAVAEIARTRAAARSLDGTVVVEHCPPAVKAITDVWEGCAGEAELEIMRRIKEKFDPAGILNPGRFIGRI